MMYYHYEQQAKSLLISLLNNHDRYVSDAHDSKL